VNVSKIFLLISSPVEQRLVVEVATAVVADKEGEEEELYEGRERRGSNWWAVQVT
jgi:hypothetical protein